MQYRFSATKCLLFVFGALTLLASVALTRVQADRQPLANDAGARLLATIDTISGRLVGRVIDEAGNGIPQVSVRAINLSTGNPRATTTNADGMYSIAALPMGNYEVEASKPGFIVKSLTNNPPPPTRVQLNKTVTRVPDIILIPAPVVTTAPPVTIPTTPAPPPNKTVPTATPTPRPTPAPSTPNTMASGSLLNQYDATRSLNVDEMLIVALPLADGRTFDTLATLAAGVMPPPQVRGVTGPGIGAGIGTAGQFAVNGQRARSNNFTVDGSDNNDEDVGVRRQGFTALIPQSIESVQEVQAVTSLWDAEAGRNAGSQINAVSKSGTNQIHGTLYNFFTHNALNARNFFDYTSDKVARYDLTATVYRRFENGNPVGARTLPVSIRNSAFEPARLISFANPSLGKDQFQRNQGGGVIGFPLRKDKTFFFGSVERQDVKARQETHFAVPTVAQRGFLNYGATGFIAQTLQGTDAAFTPTFAAGDAVFSLFPLPNHPVGPYGENTFTQVLPADGVSTIFSAKVDHSLRAFGKDHTATARYNFTNDERIVPNVGGALFSSLLPRVGTQNLSLFLNSQLSATLTNQLRTSFGRTRLRFDEQRDAFLRPSRDLPNTPWLLNAPFLSNNSDPRITRSFVNYLNVNTSADASLGYAGQVIVHPFSPVGLDVFLFPQARVNNTYQLANTLTQFHNAHTFKYGYDSRRTHLNSFLNRNYRPQIVFGGSPDLTQLFPATQAPIANPSRFGPTPGFFSGTDLAALGLPTSISQALSFGAPDSTIALRFWQIDTFFSDNWRARRGLTLDFGVRYEINTVPRESNRRIERTFALDQIPANDSAFRIAIPFAGNQTFNTQRLLTSFDTTLAALRTELGGRTGIYDNDFNNVAPRLGVAWDPFANSKRQAGKTIIRAGAGIYYDLTLGSVVSQSRNVFPTFVPFNVDANTFAYAQRAFFEPGLNGNIYLFNPNYVPLSITGAPRTNGPFLVASNTLNSVRVPEGAQRQLLGLLFNPGDVTGGRPSGGGLAFTLPERRLRTPYTFQYNLQIEREFARDYLLNVAYVGARGNKLIRFRTPNGGPNSITLPIDPLGLTDDPVLAIALPPLGDFTKDRPTRPNPALGAYTIFASSASSTYNALQATFNRRFTRNRQFSLAYTWSHALDDVSDVFDIAGAFVLPQDDRLLRAERASANFDVRHRFVWTLMSDIPLLNRMDRAGGIGEFLLGGWRFAALTVYQTGQPFTVNTSYDINLDGNLTDRLHTLSGLQALNERQTRLTLAANPTTLLAPLGTNGNIGRNTFRAAGIAKTDLAVYKQFHIHNEQQLLLRVEAFNLWNRTHFAIPVRILEAPSFGRATETLFNARQLQFALKYIF